MSIFGNSSLRFSRPISHFLRQFATKSSKNSDENLGKGASATVLNDNEDEAVSICKERENVTKEERDAIPLQTEEKIGNVKSHSFQAETRELLNIVSHSLYTDKEVFLRELISNASDATEQARYIMTMNPENFQKSDKPLEIRIYTDPDTNRIIIQDNGIGMTESQLIKNLGTIARSGSKNFLKEFKSKSSNTVSDSSDDRTSAIIGQFGVGFYSSFMVSNMVEVFSQSAVSNEGAHY